MYLRIASIIPILPKAKLQCYHLTVASISSIYTQLQAKIVHVTVKFIAKYPIGHCKIPYYFNSPTLD